MSRYPPVSPSDLSREQEALYKEASSIMDQLFQGKFTYKDEDGAFIGVYGPLMHTPALTHAYNNLVMEISKILSISVAARQTAVLTTAATFNANYSLYSHATIAAKETELTERQISSIKNGKKPEGDDQLEAACEVAFDMAIELTGKRGPLTEETWKRACEVLGKDATLAVIHLIAFHAYASVVMNGADVRAPE